MKKLLSLSFIIAFTFLTQAQIVTIPDANFKNKLLAANAGNTIAIDLLGNYIDIDTNNDNQIQVSEALQVRKLDLTSASIANLTGITSFLNLESLNCSANNLTSVDLHGLSNLNSFIGSVNPFATLDLTYLPNLKILVMYNCALTSITVTGMANLETLICSRNQLSNLNLTSLPRIKSVECQYNFITTLSVNHLTTLNTLVCGYNQLSSLNVSNLSLLNNLQFSNNTISTIDITHNPQMYSFDCSYNQLTTIDLTNSPKLQYSSFKGNLFTELDFSHVTYTIPSGTHEYSIQNNPNLAFVNLKNGQNDAVYFFDFNCPNLRYICADESDIPTFTTAMQQNSIGNVQVASYCSFVPGGEYNTIRGYITIDADNNGCGENDYHFPNVRVNINDGTNSGACFSDSLGNYTFYCQAGNYTLTPVLPISTYFAITPPTVTLSFPTINQSTQIQNFCITPIGIKNDIDIVIIPTSRLRPGFDCSYRLVYKNKGNQVISGNINFAFNDAVLDFIYANPTLDSQSTNNLNWNYTNLMPFESRSIDFMLNLNGPMETPAVNIDDILDFTATANPLSGDETPADNVFNLSQTVIGSFDPNDKSCLEGATISTLKVGDYLNYVIRFQNTGTAQAENIVVKDVIDTTKFDINSLQLITASHPQVTRIMNNRVEFIFEGINLPATITNEQLSHGYIAFKIKTKSNLVIGNAITNRANIYFDYNFPIVTNLASTTVTALGTNEFENTSVAIYPNPARNHINISAKDTITSIQLFDSIGRLITTELNNSTETDLDLSLQQSGIYFVKVYTDKGVKVEKIIKQ